MSAQDIPMRERVESLFNGIRTVLETQLGGRVNVDKWLDPVGPQAVGRGRDFVYDDLAAFLGALDELSETVPSARASVAGNEVAVALSNGSALVASFGFIRFDLIERSANRDLLVGSFAHKMGVKAFLWRFATSEWGPTFTRTASWENPCRVITGELGTSYFVRSNVDGEGPNGLVWRADNALSFARGCAYELDALLATVREFASSDRAVVKGYAPAFEERAVGCLLGGAVGDALGYPVEFEKRDEILARVGVSGVREFLPAPGVPVGAVSDDTQMTLFTAQALLQRETAVSVRAAMVDAYRGWFLTQTVAASAVPAAARERSPLLGEGWLFAQRAPGMTVMSNLQKIADERAAELIPDAANGSKGCGTVMRSAPFGLVRKWSPKQAFAFAAEASAITHGHPTAHVSAGAFAMLIRLLIDGVPLGRAAVDVMQHAQSQEPVGSGETSAILRKALDQSSAWHLAADSPKDLDALEVQGWVAEEALAIAVYCALRFPERDQIEDALSFAVTHSGDSDSTGAMCGNILGALHGVDAIPERWRDAVEGRDTIVALAGALARL